MAMRLVHSGLESFSKFEPPIYVTSEMTRFELCTELTSKSALEGEKKHTNR